MNYKLFLTNFLRTSFIVYSLSLFLFSCKKENNQGVYLGYDYFPTNVGHWIIYQCDSVYYNSFKSPKAGWDTINYQIREVIDSIYSDNEGRPTIRIVRYKRMAGDSTPWSSIVLKEKVWSGNLLSSTAQRQEDNYRYIKLIFPVNLNSQWNGNADNTLPAYNYQYTAVNTPASIGSAHFDSTLTVLQLNNSTFLEYQYYLEQYATNVGLVYRKVIDYSTDTLISNPPPFTSANSGTALYTETYLSSGN